MFFSNYFAPWLETFADARDGDGGGEQFGIFWIHFKSSLDSFQDPLCKQNMFFKHILTSSPLFEKQNISPYFELKITKTCFQHLPNKYFKICSHKQKITLNIIKTCKITNYNTNTPKTSKHISNNPCFPKYISLGLPGPLWTALELIN